MLLKFQNYMEKLAISRTRKVLLELSNRQLEDAGISRDLLTQGDKAWPWREDYVAPEKTLAVSKQIKQAKQDLNRMSDKDLRDIGITRGEINHAVVYGR